MKNKLGRLMSNAGLSLLECALAILIAGTTVISVLEISANTIRTAAYAVDNRLGALLASEILTRECSGNFPEEAAAEAKATETGEEVEYFSTGGMQDVDIEKYGEQYKGFSYDVTKYYEEVDIETELSDDAEEEEDLPGFEEEEVELPTIRIVKIKIVIYFPKEPGKDEQKTLTVETYIRPPKFASQGEEGTGE